MNPFNANPILNAGPVDPMGGPIMGPAFGPGPMMGPAFGPGPMMGPAFGPSSMDMLAGPMSPGDNLPGAVGFGDPLGGPGGGFGPYSNTPEAGPVESYFFDDPSLYNDFFQDLNSSEPQLEGIVGTNSDDTLTGDSDDNTLHGLLGDDTLDGGSGADTLNGGAGDDIYIVDNIEDVINENVNEGTDLIQTSVSFTLPQNVENITLTGTDDINAIGNSSNNIITGNTGTNELTGGGGSDNFYLNGTTSFGDTIKDFTLTDTLNINFPFALPTSQYSVTRSHFYTHDSTSRLTYNSSSNSNELPYILILQRMLVRIYLKVLDQRSFLVLDIPKLKVEMVQRSSLLLVTVLIALFGFGMICLKAME